MTVLALLLGGGGERDLTAVKPQSTCMDDPPRGMHTTNISTTSHIQLGPKIQRSPERSAQQHKNNYAAPCNLVLASLKSKIAHFSSPGCKLHQINRVALLGVLFWCGGGWFSGTAVKDVCCRGKEQKLWVESHPMCLWCGTFAMRRNRMGAMFWWPTPEQRGVVATI